MKIENNTTEYHDYLAVIFRFFLCVVRVHLSGERYLEIISSFQ